MANTDASKSKVERLKDLKALLDSGFISQEEAEAMKTDILNSEDNVAPQPLSEPTDCSPTTDIVTIHGYEESFLVNKKINIYKDGELIGQVKHEEDLIIELEDDCELNFTTDIRSSKVFIRKGIDTHVFLSFDRFTGSFKAQKSDENNASTVNAIKNQNSKNSTSATLFFLVVVILLCLILFAITKIGS